MPAYYKKMKKKQNKSAEPTQKVQIVSESAPIWKKLFDTGYVMTHPQLMIPAVIFRGFCNTLLWSAIVFVSVIIVNELLIFLNIVTNYSYMFR